MHQESLSVKLSKQFPLNALRVFDAVARHGSFTRAGTELGMTQTAVSYQIKLLEENIGEPLFLRRPRQIMLPKAWEFKASLPRIAGGMSSQSLLGEVARYKKQRLPFE